MLHSTFISASLRAKEKINSSKTETFEEMWVIVGD
jgi:hypothetical protein|tara:strand:- start:587 stop:691 length:105 start_codon:yes stop_codon:yes gene_type:complete